MRGKERPAGNREIFLAGTAAEARRAVRAPAIIGVEASAFRADCLAACLRPADLGERRFGLWLRRAGRHL
jgi:hypothetical protein